MSAHTFEVLSRAHNEILVCHAAEGHRFKFFVITNAHGKKVLSDWSRLLLKKALPIRQSFFPAVLALSPSRWPIGLTQLIDSSVPAPRPSLMLAVREGILSSAPSSRFLTLNEPWDNPARFRRFTVDCGMANRRSSHDQENQD